MTAGYGFPATRRLRKRAEFLRLSAEGRKVQQPHFLLLYRRRPDGACRFGITVSRKVGNAVVRNRIKRLVREVCRHCVTLPAADYSIIARRGAGSLALETVRHELESAFRQVPQTTCCAPCSSP